MTTRDQVQKADGLSDNVDVRQDSWQPKPRNSPRPGALRAPWRKSRLPDVFPALSKDGWDDLSSGLLQLLHPAGYGLMGHPVHSASAPHLDDIGGRSQRGRCSSSPDVSMGASAERSSQNVIAVRDRTVMPSMMRPNAIGVSGDIASVMRAQQRQHPSGKVASIMDKHGAATDRKFAGKRSSAAVAACLAGCLSVHPCNCRYLSWLGV